MLQQRSREGGSNISFKGKQKNYTFNISVKGKP